MKLVPDQILQTVQNKCTASINDSWNNLGPSVTLPTKIVNQIMQALEYYETQFAILNKQDCQKEVVSSIIHLLQNYADGIFSKPENKIGDNTVKNMAVYELIKLIKKEYDL